MTAHDLLAPNGLANPSWSDRRSVLISIAIFAASVGAMALVRLAIFPNTFIALSYGLPLLFCLWHQDTRLLWAMVVAFTGMSLLKALVIMDSGIASAFERNLHWIMQAVNLLVIGATVHIVIALTRGLRRRQLTIEQQNTTLVARGEEIAQQNEELTAQAEELAQQNEELQQQSEEMQHQTEELHQQAEELQRQTDDLQLATAESERREALLQSLILSLQDAETDGTLPTDICEPLMSLFAGKASAAMVAERDGQRYRVLSHVNLEEFVSDAPLTAQSFGAIVMREGRTAFIEDLATRPDITVPRSGSRSFRSVLATPLRLDGRVMGVVTVLSEVPQSWTREEFKIIEWVSAQCTLVMQTRRLREELQRANRTLGGEVQDRTQQLEEFVAELEHFSYTITHDLRAPLRAMQGFAALLREQHGAKLDTEGASFLDRIETAAARMDRLITDALSYSRIVRSELPLAPVDLRALLEGMVASYPSLQAPAARIDIADDLPAVLGNEAGLTQLFSNLLGNAVKFVPPGRIPHVRIFGERQNGTVRVCVADNGIGIDPAMHDRVFVMFQRLSKDYEGTGIGLALVKKIAERMGGSVTLQSEPGDGCRFWVQMRAANGSVQ